MTKVTTLQSLIGGTTEQKEGKPIEFIYQHDCQKGSVFTKAGYKPSSFQHVVLALPAASYEYYDLMIAYDKDIADTGYVFLGHWNDGFVEQ